MNKNVHPDSVAERIGKCRTAVVDRDIVILDEKELAYHSLNVTSAAVWRLLDQPRSIRTIARELMTTFEVDEATCLREITHLLVRLRQVGLIAIHPPGGSPPG